MRQMSDDTPPVRRSPGAPRRAEQVHAAQRVEDFRRWGFERGMGQRCPQSGDQGNLFPLEGNLPAGAGEVEAPLRRR